MKPNLCIIGSHPAALADIESMPNGAPWDYMAIGLDAADKYLGEIRYIATYHPVEIDMIRERRRAAGGNLDYRAIAHESKPGIDIVITDWWTPSGSSALLGTQAALRLGYRRIVLCGCPLTGVSLKGSKYETFQRGWTARKKEVAPYVRSMSGWTAAFLGKPTVEWLAEGMK